MVTDRQIKSRTTKRHILHLFDNVMKQLHDGKPRYSFKPGRCREDILKANFYFTSEVKEKKDGPVQEITLHWTYINYKGVECKSYANPVGILLYNNDQAYHYFDRKTNKWIMMDYAKALDLELIRHLTPDWLVKDHTAIPIYL